MLRRRSVAAAPRRSASETWDAVASLVIRTLERSPHLDAKDVTDAMLAAASAGRVLVAGGHLDLECLTLVAGSVHCEITTVSGVDAIRLEEDLAPVPGASEASTYMIYLPTPTPLEDLIRTAAKSHDRLSAATPPEPAKTQSASAGPVVDLEALRRAAVQR